MDGVTSVAGGSWPTLEFDTYRATVGRPVDVEKWVSLLGKPVLTEDKHSVPLWAPMVSRENRKRYEDVHGVSALVLDYDDGTPIEAAQDTWANYVHVLHTSWSHTEDVPRFRVVLPFDPSWPIISVSKYEEVWRWACLRTGRAIDGQCKNHNRLWFLPSAKEIADFHIKANKPSEGVDWLDPERISCPAEPPPPKPTYRPVTIYGEKAERVMRDRMLHDPETRERLMEPLGAHREGVCAKGAVCPACADRSLVWVIEPTNAFRAWCNHRNTCGWRGHLWELACT